ncbi:hypothetical protein BC792_11251 [Sphingobacterium allocomposti]|uniref:Uncharacterized protein n=1 Tax=Sphingobacterium allocomposti TaxID=415956 RepID=A0A5S5DEI8_9SPHI|nr:hypothetical protein BC792_11251 [Sphingobacterium composti Yoo et al. 2007 non Ten et al. 2007]
MPYYKIKRRFLKRKRLFILYQPIGFLSYIFNH